MALVDPDRGCDEVRLLLKFAVTSATVRTVFMKWRANSMIIVSKWLADPVLVLQYFSVGDGS